MQQPAQPQYANYWAPLMRKRHTLPHPAQPRQTPGGAAGPYMRHPPPPLSFENSSAGGHGANGAKFFVPCLVEGGTMPSVLKTLKTFFRAKTRNRYYLIHTSIPPCLPNTHTPLRYACCSSGSRVPPPPAELPIPPPPPPRKFWQIAGGGVASGPVVVAPPGAHQPLGSANAETTPAGALAAAADRKQRPDATCEGKNG